MENLIKILLNVPDTLSQIRLIPECMKGKQSSVTHHCLVQLHSIYAFPTPVSDVSRMLSMLSYLKVKSWLTHTNIFNRFYQFDLTFPTTAQMFYLLSTLGRGRVLDRALVSGSGFNSGGSCRSDEDCVRPSDSGVMGFERLVGLVFLANPSKLLLLPDRSNLFSSSI